MNNLMEKQELKNYNKRFNSNSPTSDLYTFSKLAQPNAGYNPSFIQYRKTDYTDQINSQVTNSQVNRQMTQRQSQNYRPINYGLQQKSHKVVNQGILQIFGEKQQRIVQLKERLKNIHHFYRIRIEQQRNKNIQRSQIFIGLIEQLQLIHNQKIINGQKSLQQMQEDKKQLGAVDERVSSMQKTIQDILEQTSQLKQKKQIMQEQCEGKRILIKQKEDRIQKVKQELFAVRQKLQDFQKLNLKQHKRKKQVMEMITKIS